MAATSFFKAEIVSPVVFHGRLISQTPTECRWMMTLPNSTCAPAKLVASSSKRSSVFSSRTQASSSIEGAAVQSKDVQIISERGISYDLLQEKLAAGEWEAADSETRRLICVLAGEAAAKRKWVYFTEVKDMPSADLQTIDRLWRAYSDDKFGFTVQRRLFNALGRRWKPFFLKIGWTYGENSTYKKFPMEFNWDIEAPVGHLPLTNALRGTLLFQNILLHPAFSAVDLEQTMPDDTELPSFVSEQEPDAKKPTGGIASGTGSIFDEGFNSADYGF